MVFFPLIPQLLHKRVVMARTAPRHLNLLRNAGPRFQVVPSRFKGQLSKASFPTPYAYAMETAKQKTLEVARRMHQKHGKDAKDADCTATVESLPPTAIVKMIYGLKVSQVSCRGPWGDLTKGYNLGAKPWEVILFLSWTPGV
ncbi:probable bifunctional dTTP/UTP pyrophosphatase/methyltransferase protein isoform X2 [Artibeus jamaicensis]|uniref:probable bifunctional dTTP/UTP pyrophosphatase/methyltransferase protein isoform X2 n=1 Tax=Artibeus jamaicensis TaxID=9417 RepID=UPI00235AB7C9|nr:probable bifunctional dTTP/UTP pyrophosphatase/methyltransferase protein isoform X2 [Artibeus jamaicensis]